MFNQFCWAELLIENKTPDSSSSIELNCDRLSEIEPAQMSKLARNKMIAVAI